MVTFPSVEATIMVLPVEDGPNSFDRSTVIVNIVPSTRISTFFMIVSFQHANCDRLLTVARSAGLVYVFRSRVEADESLVPRAVMLAEQGRADELFGDAW